MTNTSKHLLESQIVDYVLGYLPPNDQELITAHIQHCEKCRDTYLHWEKTLKSTPSYSPSPLLKERLWHNFELEKQRRENRFSHKRIISIASLAAMILLIVGLFYYQNHPSQHTLQVAQTKDVNIEDFQSNLHTKQWTIVPVASSEIQGNIWFNPVTNQMFLEIYGIRKPQNRDYQLWMIYKDNHVRDQILPVKNGSIKIFIQGKNFHQIKQIRASMEPKGGSIIQTGPDTFIIEVKY